MAIDLLGSGAHDSDAVTSKSIMAGSVVPWYASMAKGATSAGCTVIGHDHRLSPTDTVTSRPNMPSDMFCTSPRSTPSRTSTDSTSTTTSSRGTSTW